MVDLDELTTSDLELLEGMIKKHFLATNSTVARDILESWIVESKKFIKVFPRDYKRILMQKKLNQATVAA
jgi:glutamate synthase (NADPH/NADH) large chain